LGGLAETYREITRGGASMTRPVITLLSDFGVRDYFVGAMKGVILGICPDAVMVDLTHDLSSQAVSEAAFVLGCAYSHFPPRTVHVAVVDPGVGGQRKPLAARCGEHLLVGPDNGIMSYAFADHSDFQAFVIENPRCRLSEVSATFHGRDIFAPAAAHLAAGMPLEEIGPPLGQPVLLALPTPRESEHRLEAHVIHVDRFGNLVTDLRRRELDRWLGGEPSDRVSIEAGQRRLRGIKASYESVAEGRPLALIGSTDRLEIAVNRGSASDALGLAAGDAILLRKERVTSVARRRRLRATARGCK
jgi:hypothetical protein